MRIREILEKPNSDGEWAHYCDYSDAINEEDGESFTVIGGRPHKNGELWISHGGFWEKQSSK